MFSNCYVCKITSCVISHCISKIYLPLSPTDLSVTHYAEGHLVRGLSLTPYISLCCEEDRNKVLTSAKETRTEKQISLVLLTHLKLDRTSL